MSAAAVIDSLEFARSGQHVSGSLAVGSLPRLDDVVADHSGSLVYEVDGGRDEQHRPQLRLRVRGMLKLQCQRCLEPLEYPLDIASKVLVVPAGAVPEDADDAASPDYIEAQRELDLAELIEDEIVLSLPFAPRHEAGCAEAVAAKDEDEAKSDSPFAALAALKNSDRKKT